MNICTELIGRKLGQRIRWYAYCATIPFDEELALAMAQAGCVGINFTADAANPGMLKTYQQPHNQEDLARAVRLCKKHHIAVMLDLLFGGPGETPQTVAQSIQFWKQIDPDCAGAGLGIRLYPNTPITNQLNQQGPLEQNPNIRRNYSGPIDLFHPTFYVAQTLGPRPAALVRELIDNDPRFFPPQEPTDLAATNDDHNYNDNPQLTDAIAQGMKGAYWHILHQLKNS